MPPDSGDAYAPSVNPDARFLCAMWLLPVAFGVHELEEWNILEWYRRYFTDLPPISNTSVHIGLILTIVSGFLWTAFAALCRRPKPAAFLVLFYGSTVLLNALQHLYWVVLFQGYSPGVFIAVVLLLPVNLYLCIPDAKQRLVPWWYFALLALVIASGLLATVKAGNTMTPQIRAIHNFTISITHYFTR